jgi:hypothetical protein
MKNYRKIKRKTSTLPLLLTYVRGAIGKEYVIKHYRYGIIKTKYPDMSRIVASEGQRSCRSLFRESVARAQKVMADPVQKAAWLKKVRQKHLVFNMIIKAFMLAEKKAAKKREMTGKYLVRSCFKTIAPHTAGPDMQATGAVTAGITHPLPEPVYRE